MTGHYEGYNVLRQLEHWDGNTQRAVKDRLEFPKKFTFFGETEIKILEVYLHHLLDEERGEILSQVISYLDTTLQTNDISNYRKIDEPDIQTIFKVGLQGINEASNLQYGQDYWLTNEEQQQKIVEALAVGNGAGTAWQTVAAATFFNKVLSMAVDYYYSLPLLWSEIGYGGPAYPRGYVRTEFGGLDPWEAKRNE